MAVFSLKVVPLLTRIPLYILFHSTASMTGPILPVSSYVSSAAHFATRTVDAALYEAIVARAMKISTCLGGKLRERANGDLIPREEKIVLKALIDDR